MIIWIYASKSNSGSHYSLCFCDFFRLISIVSISLDCSSLNVIYDDLIHMLDDKYMNILIKRIKKDIAKGKKKELMNEELI